MHKNTKNMSNIISSCALAVVLAGCDEGPPDEGSTAAVYEVEVTPAELGLGDDWTMVDAGLWTRIDESGEEVFLGLGAAGNRHALASLEAVERELVLSAQTEDSELAQTQLAEIQGFIAEVRHAPMVDPSESPMLRCSIALNLAASAYPSTCGVAASSSAYFSNPCSTTVETVKTYAKATCGYSTTTHQCGPLTKNPASCYSSTSIVGAAPCDSYALAQGTYYSTWSSNVQRGACSNGPSATDNCGPCSAGKDCHCGDTCRLANSVCP